MFSLILVSEIDAPCIPQHYNALTKQSKQGNWFYHRWWKQRKSLEILNNDIPLYLMFNVGTCGHNISTMETFEKANLGSLAERKVTWWVNSYYVIIFSPRVITRIIQEMALICVCPLLWGSRYSPWKLFHLKVLP